MIIEIAWYWTWRAQSFLTVEDRIDDHKGATWKELPAKRIEEITKAVSSRIQWNETLSLGDRVRLWEDYIWAQKLDDLEIIHLWTHLDRAAILWSKQSWESNDYRSEYKNFLRIITHQSDLIPGHARSLWLQNSHLLLLSFNEAVFVKLFESYCKSCKQASLYSLSEILDNENTPYTPIADQVKVVTPLGKDSGPLLSWSELLNNSSSICSSATLGVIMSSFPPNRIERFKAMLSRTQYADMASYATAHLILTTVAQAIQKWIDRKFIITEVAMPSIEIYFRQSPNEPPTIAIVTSGAVRDIQKLLFDKWAITYLSYFVSQEFTSKKPPTSTIQFEIWNSTQKFGFPAGSITLKSENT
jgi:hypothetical protein